MNISLIPPGGFCYRIAKIRNGEVVSKDIAKFGKELREYRYRGNYKEILCPYWQRTEYGTVRCNFLDKEFIDDEDDKAQEKIAEHFAISGANKNYGYSWALSDEIKICGISEYEDTEWID